MARNSNPNLYPHRLTARRREDDQTPNKFGWPGQVSVSTHHTNVPCRLNNLDATTALSIDAEFAVYEHIVHTEYDIDLLPGDVLSIEDANGNDILPSHSRTVVKGVVDTYQAKQTHAAQSVAKIGRAL